MGVTGISEVRQYLTFKLGEEIFALDVAQVREILDYTTITKVPQTPEYMRGVINLRGSVVPVIDLALKFGLPACEITRRTCIVIVEVQHPESGEVTVMGVMADAVSQVRAFTPEDIEPAPDFGTRVRIDLLLGMGRMGKKFALLLDSDRLLATEELLSVSTATSAASAEPGEGGEVAATAPAEEHAVQEGGP